MAEKNNRRNKTTDALFDAILSLETREAVSNTQLRSHET